MNVGNLGLILTGVLLNAVAQLLLKTGARAISGVDIGIANTGAIFAGLALNMPVLAGIACYAVSVVFWILALSRVDVSMAYPMLSLGYVVNAAGAWWLLGENVTPQRIAAIGVIVLGTWLLAHS